MDTERDRTRSTSLARFAMKTFEAEPAFSVSSVGELQEIFNHQDFLDGSEVDRQRVMLGSAEAKYSSETHYPWDNYFGFSLEPLLAGKTALDLGCFNGGRSIAWLERYKLAHITGIDINEVYIETATEFAAARQASADFVLATGEKLPFEEASFDAVLSFDVFEHVRDVDATLAECHRVLKPGGMLFVVFPGYFHPTEHHLSLATRTPCLHWVFKGQTLVAAYDQVLSERGADAAWYKRKSPQLAEWERGNTTNGTTLAAFERLIAQMEWQVVSAPKRPVGAIGRNAHRSAKAQAVSRLLRPFVHVPGIREFVLHRITYMLVKWPAGARAAES
jgi:2-polyprenyl-3-methyl-5-hydroxy-6-metoxy-1,4-benzoquinol methylase